MPIVNYKKYCEMLDNAQENNYAFPAINVSSLESANAALTGFAKAKSDGIIQVSIGGAEHASGYRDMVFGAISLANHIHLMADKYNVNIALHTDHCRIDKLDSFIKPLIAETEKRRANGEANLFNSHMFDGSDLQLDENLKISIEMLHICAKNEIILEVEAGVFGGEEDGINNENVPSEKLYTTPKDMLKVYEALKDIPNSRYMFAATFGNVHGVYKPGNVKLKPKILKYGQEELCNKYGNEARFDLVFHGGSGSSKEEILETLQYGVVKMNIDTDTQYAFTRPIADYMFKNYDGVLKVDGEVGIKKIYDPRAYLKIGAKGITDRVIAACKDLNSAGRTIS
ncbi:MAG: class II fructose-bisphosphate aldolase [Clostridiales bacterium]|nr:class II fructose-bisphosphate aldolase [Clostridiales bacterium]